MLINFEGGWGGGLTEERDHSMGCISNQHSPGTDSPRLMKALSRIQSMAVHMLAHTVYSNTVEAVDKSVTSTCTDLSLDSA